MSRQKSIEALISKCQQSFGDLKQDYQTSLDEKKVSEELKIDIKNIFENLRSCLDYMAHGIHEKCVDSSPPQRLYFPIRSSHNDFCQVMKIDYTGIDTSFPKVFNILESIQPYNDEWLGKFNKLNNNNKHQDLEEQTRTETKRVTVSSKQGGSSVSWGSGVTFGSGVSVMGVPIDPKTQMPVPNKTTDTKVEIWVDFKFRENGESVLPFIKKSIDSVERIFKDLADDIYG